ncbi:MAG: type IX secretion system protein PorQ [Bacteroidota bacterium]
MNVYIALKKVLFFISVFLCFNAFAQVGGTRAYRFLDIPMTARSAALGGNNMSIWGDDINLIYSNPALLNPTMTKQIALNYSNYVSDLNFGYLASAYSLKEHGTVAASMQFFGYGKFTGYDETGEKTNSFRANDYSLNLTYAKPMGDSLFNIGIALKTIISQYDVYTSVGNALDFGITYHGRKNLVASILVKNVGYIWKGYTSNSKSEALPRNVQLGLSYKIAKAPFRIFFVYDNLLTRNLKYINPLDTIGSSNPFGSTTSKKDSTGWQKFKERSGNRIDNFMRHFTFGTEILLTKNFNLRVAYNYRRQREMTISERRGVNGLSFGFGLRVKRFGFSYSFSKMAFAGNSSVFGVTLSL